MDNNDIVYNGGDGDGNNGDGTAKLYILRGNHQLLYNNVWLLCV